MRPATVSAARHLRSVFWTILVVSAALDSVGCARIQQFRKDDRPVLGALGSERSKASNTAKAAPTTAKAADPYAQALRNKKAEADRALLAERSTGKTPTTESDSVVELDADQAASQPSTGSGRSGSADSAPLRVTLQPPETLDEGQAVLTARRSDPPSGWQSPKAEVEERDPPLKRAATVQPQPEREKPRVSAESLVSEARARLDQLGNYQVSLNRQERVGARLLPVEDVLLSVRRSPKAVRLEWPDGPHKGREVIYSASENGGLMQVNMADSVVPMPRMSLPPDSPLVMSNSRHPITEAGFDGVLANLEHAIDAEKAGSPTSGMVKYAGLVETDGLDHACHKLVRVTPNRETWLVFLDPQSKLPALVQGNAADGSLLERYRFLDVKGDVPALAQGDAFDVNRRWGPPKGLLSRLTRPTTGPAKSAEAETIVR